MDRISEALRQVVLMLIITGSLLATIELSLYWLLYWYKRCITYWIVNVLIGTAIGLVMSLLLNLSSPHNFTAIISGIIVFMVCGFISKFIIKGRCLLAIMMIMPALIVVSLIIIYPFFFQFRLAFANLNLYTIGRWINDGELGWVGLRNFSNVFTTSPLQTATFWTLLLRTFIWTGINLVFHVTLGLGLALLLNRKILAKGIYRTLLIIPWAMPQVVAVLAWRGEFHPQFGFVNSLFSLIGLGGINWWSDPLPVFASCCIVNIWLGIPFMMVVFLGGLQSIPHSYYEAASIDGASKLRQFWDITLPMLKPVVVPSVTLGTIWTFNNITVIYLMTGQDGGKEFADILVSALYKSAFTYSRYSFSAAFAIVIFAILIAITMLWMKISRGTESIVAEN